MVRPRSESPTINDRKMQVKFTLEVVLEYWDLGIFEDTRQISLDQMVSYLW